MPVSKKMYLSIRLKRKGQAAKAYLPMDILYYNAFFRLTQQNGSRKYRKACVFFSSSLLSTHQSIKIRILYIRKIKPQALLIDTTYPCGETQEVFYELLLSRERYPLDTYRFAGARLEGWYFLLEHFQRLWLTYHRCSSFLLV